MEQTLHNSPETTAIRQRMKEVRRELDEDVQEIVEGARDLRDWRSYVRSYPWLCLGAAVAAGYLIVPRRSAGPQPAARTLAELPKSLAASQSPPLPNVWSNVRSHVLAVVGDMVLRGVAAYALQQAGKIMATPSPQSPQDEQP